MRRKDREMDEKFALNVIDEADYGVLSFCHENKSYSRALSFGRKGKTLYFHSATEGEKAGLFYDGMEAEVVFVSHVSVPKLYEHEKIKELMGINGPTFLLSKIFTTEFSSAMVRGKLRLVDVKEEKTEALRRVCQRFTPDMMEFFDEAAGMSLDKLSIYGLDLYEIHGKRKKFDDKGEEMKWGRME